jgi:phage-related protein
LHTRRGDDIFFGIEWEIETELEVDEWFGSLKHHEFGFVAFHIDRLAFIGSMLRMPHSRSLGGGLFELRFDLDRVAWRISYFFTAPRRIVLLTVFRKQRQNERNEIERARTAMLRCITEQHVTKD